MLSALRDRIFGSSKKSRSLAKSRLHFVLVQDRTGLSNEEMADFRKEILDVVEKYFVIDKQAFDISYQRDSDTTTLVINSPVIVNRREAPKYQAGAVASSKKKKKGKPAAANAG